MNLSEHNEQRLLFLWAEKHQGDRPELRLLYAIPNGGKRDIRTAAQLKAEGVKAGVPDTHLPVARNGFHGLYIELKRIRDGRVSDEQRQWIADLTAEGYRCAVCLGYAQAVQVIEEYLNP
jgi:hypothetical protein